MTIILKPVEIVVAATFKGGIGKNGDLPWPKLSSDLKHLNKTTTTTQDASKRNGVIMGRKTWSSLPPFMRPLKGRKNIVVTSTALDEVSTARSVKEAVDALQADPEIGKIFILGGEGIYRASLEEGLVTKVHLTRIACDPWECDTRFPLESIADWVPVKIGKTIVENNVPFDICEFVPPATRPFGLPTFSHEEYQYLSLIDKIITTGIRQDDRTGVGTVNLFGAMMRFDLKESFPLLTTKRVFWKGVVEELLWFVKGDTNANHLAEKGVKIWDGNGSREFLDSRGLHNREQGDLGPVYGFQWRHFGAQYIDMHTDYAGQGFDQLSDCIHKIKNNPTDRRIIMSAWNPSDLQLMALPPCHMFCQFYVANGELSCAMYQRSADMGLGVPFNIASYALLTCMMAKVCGLKPGEFIHNLGNAHVYLNHIEPLKEQLTRTPKPFPALRITRDVLEIDGFKADDFELVGYNPWGKINMEMAV